MSKAKQLDGIDGEGCGAGVAYVVNLWNDEPTAAHACHYAAIVRDRAILLEQIGTATEIRVALSCDVHTGRGYRRRPHC